MILVNNKGEKCDVEICRRNADTPVLLVGGQKIFPSQVAQKYWQLVYASRQERRALVEGGYSIADAPTRPLRLI